MTVTELADQRPELPAPPGPETARQVADQHRAAGRHTHLVTNGEIECLSARCTPAYPAGGS